MIVERRSHRGAWVLFAVGLAVPVGSATAAQPPARTLGTPIARFEEPFIEVGGVRELRDGRVIVLDRRDQQLHLVDFTTGTATPIGRQGDGPGEYRLPLQLWPLPGDSTGVHDMARPQGLFIVRPDGRAGGLLSTSGDPPGSSRLITPHAVDQWGRYYLLDRPGMSPVGAGRPAASPDATPIARVDPRTGIWETVAHIDGRVNRAHFRNQQGTPGLLPPFSTADQWAVALDGRIAIVTVTPYQVTFVHPNGQTARGPELPAERIRLSAGHRAAWLEDSQRPRATISGGANQQTSYGFRSMNRPPPTDWPEYLRPFVLSGSDRTPTVQFAPDGTLWIHRTTAAGAPPAYDLIDASGRLAMRLTLPRRSILVGFGAASVYLVHLDDDDLQYLRRHPLPR